MINRANIKMIRLNKELSIEEVSINLNIPLIKMIEYELDSKQIPICDAVKLLDLYGVSFSEVRFNQV